MNKRNNSFYIIPNYFIMAEFQMPMSSIPNSKIYINENTMKKIMDQNKG